MSKSARTYAKACALAKERGCYVIEPGPRELFVDIDAGDTHAVLFFEKMATVEEGS